MKVYFYFHFRGPDETSSFMRQTDTFLDNRNCQKDDRSLFTCDGSGWRESRARRTCVAAGVTCYNQGMLMLYL